MKKIFVAVLIGICVFGFVSCEKKTSTEIKEQIKKDWDKAKKSLSFNDYKINFVV